MLIKIFTVHDSKAEAFIQPFFAQTTGLATRSFEQAANETGHDFNRYAGDYSLFELGTFDQGNAQFNILPTPLNLGLAITYINCDTNAGIRETAETQRGLAAVKES